MESLNLRGAAPTGPPHSPPRLSRRTVLKLGAFSTFSLLAPWRTAWAEDKKPGAIIILWLAGGPSATWALHGDADWSAATGSYDAGAHKEFANARVHAEGGFAVVPKTNGDAFAQDQFRGSGEFAVAFVDEQPLASAAVPPIPPTVAWSLAAVAAVILALLGTVVGGRVIGAFYTRFAPHELLSHPTRNRMRELALAEPGIHLRELNPRDKR